MANDDRDVWVNTRTGEEFTVTVQATHTSPPVFAPLADPDAAADPDPRCPECNGEMQPADHDGVTLSVCEDCGYNVPV